MQQLEILNTKELQKLLVKIPDGMPIFATEGAQYFAVNNLICRELKKNLRHFCEITLSPCLGGKISTQPVLALKKVLNHLDTYTHFVCSTGEGQTYRVLELGKANLGSGEVLLLKMEISE